MFFELKIKFKFERLKKGWSFLLRIRASLEKLLVFLFS
nr:MAG TPA: Get5 C-terminal domain [Caudoviricetes sp.]